LKNGDSDAKIPVWVFEAPFAFSIIQIPAVHLYMIVIAWIFQRIHLIPNKNGKQLNLITKKNADENTVLSLWTAPDFFFPYSGSNQAAYG
jgi:hypothetical protein